MIRKFRKLSLGLFAALFVSAVAVPAAFAQTAGVLTAPQPVTLIGTETLGGVNAVTAFGSTVSCTDVYTGHKKLTTAETATKKHELLPNGSIAVTITPHYTNCNNPVVTNGCDYELYEFITAPGEALGTYVFKFDIVCPVGQSIFIDGPIFCDTTIPPQTGLSGPHLTNESGHLRLQGTLKNTKMKNVCLGETATAELHMDVTIKAHDAAGAKASISLGH